jgi:hypothetical protein
MEVDSRKPNEWVEIANEPNCRFVTTHVRVLLLKGPTHLPCLALSSFASPCLALAPFCLALPTLSDKNKSPPPPAPNPNLYVSCVEATVVAWLLSDCIDTCAYTPCYLPALAELCKNPLVIAPVANSNNYTQ